MYIWAEDDNAEYLIKTEKAGRYLQSSTSVVVPIPIDDGKPSPGAALTDIASYHGSERASEEIVCHGVTWDNLWADAYGTLQADEEYSRLLIKFKNYVKDEDDAALGGALGELNSLTA